MKKMVELDPTTMTTKEFDHVKIMRSAQQLKEYILTLTPETDIFHIRALVLPIVEQALSGKLSLPFNSNDKPLRRESGEGLLPHEYSRLAAPFFVAICGMSGLGSEMITPVEKDGRIYARMEFEGPSS